MDAHQLDGIFHRTIGYLLATLTLIIPIFTNIAMLLLQAACPKLMSLIATKEDICGDYEITMDLNFTRLVFFFSNAY